MAIMKSKINEFVAGYDFCKFGTKYAYRVSTNGSEKIFISVNNKKDVKMGYLMVELSLTEYKQLSVDEVNKIFVELRNHFRTGVTNWNMKGNWLDIFMSQMVKKDPNLASTYSDDAKELDKIKELDNEIIPQWQLNDLYENEFVTNVECLGASGRYVNHWWHSIELSDGSDIDVFTSMYL